MALAPMLVNGTVGAVAAAGTGALLNWGLNKFAIDVPQPVRDSLPAAGAALLAGLEAISKKTRSAAIPTLLGGLLGAAMIFGVKYMAGAKGYRRSAGAYNRLRGSGNATRALNAAAPGAGNAARALSMVA